MAMRKIETVSTCDHHREAMIYRVTEWDEYQVRFYIHGQFQKDATYFCDDLDDARGTAKHWVESNQGEGARA